VHPETVELERVPGRVHVLRGYGHIDGLGDTRATIVTDGGERVRLVRTGFVRRRYRATTPGGEVVGGHDAPVRFGAGGELDWRGSAYRLDTARSLGDDRVWVRTADGTDLVEVALTGSRNRPFRVTVARAAADDQALVLFAVWLASHVIDTTGATT